MVIGSIAGIIGSISSNLFAIFKMREERQLEMLRMQDRENERKHEQHLFKLQSQARVEETEREIALTDVSQSYAGLQSSIADQTEATRGSYKWVKAVLALFRPFITTCLVAAVLILAFNGHSALAASTFADIAVAAILWWFGDRSSKRTLESMRGGRIRAAGGEF